VVTGLLTTLMMSSYAKVASASGAPKTGKAVDSDVAQTQGTHRDTVAAVMIGRASRRPTTSSLPLQRSRDPVTRSRVQVGGRRSHIYDGPLVKPSQDGPSVPEHPFVGNAPQKTPEAGTGNPSPTGRPQAQGAGERDKNVQTPSPVWSGGSVEAGVKWHWHSFSGTLA
jgi:hypothetical protein